MWQTTTSRLLIATFWFAVAFGAILIETKEPYGILVASMALAFAVVSLLDPRSRFVRSERASVVLTVSMLVGLLVIIGLAFAVLGR